MPVTFTDTPTTSVKVKSYRPDYVFVVQLHSGVFVIGQAHNPAKRIASINSGLNPSIKGSLQINRVIGVKEQSEERTFAGVVRKFCKQYGEDKVIAV